MADEKSGQPNKRRRPPTTIELKATEVASAQAAKAEPVDSPAESPRTEAAEPGPQPETEPAAPSAAERPRAGGWRERLDLSGLNARLASLRGRATERVDWRLIGAGGAGAAAMLAVFLALWGFGAFNTRDDLTVMLAARLAMTEQQVRDLANRPPPPGVDQRALAELAARIGAAEQAMGRLSDLDARVGKAEAAAAAPRAAQPDAALTARVTTLEGATREAKSRADAAFELAQKAPAQAPTVAPAELQALASRVAALEQGAKAAQEKIAVNAGADRAGRLAFVAVALRGAVERGAPFAQEFAAAKPLVPDAAALSALEPFAASGVPRTAALARELSQLTGSMLSAAGAVPREGGILDRIQQNAERLVRIRPINEAPGDDAATVVARADVKASHGDLAGALAELGALPPAVRAPAEAWIRQAQAQLAALAAARGLADGAIGALGKAAP
jgi:hypothetical protein